MHFPRAAIAFLGLLLLTTGCSRHGQDAYQGYAEGEFVYVASSQPGRLDQLAVVRGQQVTAGTPLFVLESVQELAAQRQAQHQLAAAQAQLEDLKTAKRPAEIAVTSAQLAQSEIAAQKSASQRDRDEAQYRAGGISEEQVEATRAQASADAAKVRELEHQVQVAKLPGREQQIRAQSEQVKVADAAVTEATWKLSQKTLVAPGDGLVYDTLYREGEWIAAGSPVIRMLPPANIKVRFFVPEPVAGGLVPGRAVSVRCDGCSSEISATVSFISPESEYTPPVIYSNETRAKLVYMIEARPAPQDAPKLHPGQPLEVRLQ
jgi:HlyD family secretion protein